MIITYELIIKMQIQQLISYTQQLELQNKQLKKHIFNIQQQLNEHKETITILQQKQTQVQNYVTQCEQEIIKRDQREIALIQRGKQLEGEMGIYLEEINRVKGQIGRRDSTGINLDDGKKMRLPPKAAPQKCKNCEILSVDKQTVLIELQAEREKCYILQRDVQCLLGTFCSDQ